MAAAELDERARGARATASGRSGSGTPGSCRRTSGAGRPSSRSSSASTRRPVVVHRDRRRRPPRRRRTPSARRGRSAPRPRPASPGSTSAWHISAMHSIPPLVTISSSTAGRRPCSCSWRSRRYSRTLGMPRARRVLQRDARRRRAAAARRSRRARPSGTSPRSGSRRSSRARPAGCRRGSRSARRRRAGASGARTRPKSGIDPERQRARLAAVERRDVLGVVRQVVQRLAARLRGEDRALAARDRLGGLERGRDPLRRRDQRRRRRRRTRRRRVTPRRRRSATVAPERGPRDRRARRAGSCRARTPAARRRRRPREVAAAAVDDDPGEPAPPRLGREQLAERRRAARRSRRSPARRRAPPRPARSCTGRWSSSATTVNAGPAIRTSGHHRPHRGIDDRQRLVGVAQRGDVDRAAAARSGPRQRACHMRTAGLSSPCRGHGNSRCAGSSF